MADFYWVGGNGTWDTTSTTNWSSSSGGAGGAGVPGANDIARLDAGSGAAVVTLGEDIICQILAMTGFTGTLDFVTYKISLTRSGASTYLSSTSATLLGTKLIEATYSGGVGTRTFSCGGVTEANAINLVILAGTDTVNVNGNVNNLNLTGFGGTFAGASRTIYGDFIIGSGTTISASNSSTIFEKAAGTQEITTNNKTLDFPISFGNSGGTSLATRKLIDDCTLASTRQLTFFSGTLDTNDKNLSVGLISLNFANTRTFIFGTGTVNVTGNNGIVFNHTNSSNLTITGTPNIYLTYSGSTGTRTIRGGNAGTGTNETNSFNIFVNNGSDTVDSNFGIRNFNLTGFSGTLSRTVSALAIWGDFVLPSGITNTASSNALSFMTPTSSQITTAGVTLNSPINFGFNGLTTVTTGSYEFQDALTQGSSYTTTIYGGTVELKNSVTSTVGAFATSGSNQKFLQSTLLGSQATLSQASGTVSVQNLTIRDINATGGATWNAFVTDGNVDGGNNTGWDFFAQLGKYIYTRRKNKRILL